MDGEGHCTLRVRRIGPDVLADLDFSVAQCGKFALFNNHRHRRTIFASVGDYELFESVRKAFAADAYRLITREVPVLHAIAVHRTYAKRLVDVKVFHLAEGRLELAFGIAAAGFDHKLVVARFDRRRQVGRELLLRDDLVHNAGELRSDGVFEIDLRTHVRR